MQDFATLVNSSAALEAAGVHSAEMVAHALGKMIAAAENKAELEAVQLRLRAMGAAGVISAGQVADGMEKATEQAKKLCAAIEDLTLGTQSLAEAARRAGVDVGLLTTGVSDGFAKGVKNVRDLVDEVAKSGVEARRASPLLADALNKSVEAAKTKEELELLTKAIEQARVSGKLMGDDLTAALDKVSQKASKLGTDYAAIFKDQERNQKLMDNPFREGVPGGPIGCFSYKPFDGSTMSLNSSAGTRSANNPWGERSDVDKAPDSNTIGSTYTPPPDNSGDWEWVTNGSQGQWQMSRAAVQPTPRPAAPRWRRPMRAWGWTCPTPRPSRSARCRRPCATSSTTTERRSSSTSYGRRTRRLLGPAVRAPATS